MIDHGRQLAETFLSILSPDPEETFISTAWLPGMFIIWNEALRETERPLACGVAIR